jgi:hypothetical protein
MRKHVLTLFLVLALALSTTGAALAQELPEPFCGDLADEDCEVIQNSQAALLEVDSYTSTSELEFYLTGVPDLPVEELAFSWTQDVNIAMDPELMQEMAAFMTMPPEEMMENTEAMTNFALEFYKGLDLDADFTLTMPEEIAELLSADSPVEIPAEISLQVIMVDGFGYVNTEDLAVFEPSIADMGEWVGIDFVGLMEMGFEQSMAAQDPMQQQGMMTGFAVGSMFSSEEIRNLFEDYLVIERGNDAEVSGEDAAVFTTSFDFPGFVASEGLWNLLEENLDLINQLSETKFTAAELQQGRMALTFLGPAIFQTLNLETSQTIGLNDYYPYASEFDLSWDLSTVMQFAQSMQGGNTPRAGQAPAAEFSLTMSTTNSDFNDAPAIEAPEDAFIVPLEALENME